MLLLAYAFLVGVVAWAFGRRGGPWILRLSAPGQQWVRLAAGMLDTAVGALGIVVLGLQLGADDYAHVLGWTIGAAVSLGGVVYAAGLLAWRGGQALGLRILGWVVMVTALAIPSTLTLGLPVVALLALALAPSPSRSCRADRQADRRARAHASLPEHWQDIIMRNVRTSSIGSAQKSRRPLK